MQTRSATRRIKDKLNKNLKHKTIEQHDGAQLIKPEAINFDEALDKVGEGNFSEVFKGEYDGQCVAVKKIHLEPAHANFKSQQAAIMMELNHLKAPQVIRLLAYTAEILPYYLVMPFMSNGSLYSHIDNTSKPPLSAAICFNILMGVSKALAFMHKHLVIHCDVKPDNILLDDHFEPHVIDFDSAAHLDANRAANHTLQLGTLTYMAPERLTRSEPYTTKTDVYAFTMTMWEVLAWRTAFAEVLNNAEVQTLVITGTRMPIPDGWHEDVRRVIESGWQQASQQRPEMQEIHDQIETHENEFTSAMSMRQ